MEARFEECGCAGCGAWIGWCACSIPQPVSCSARPVPLDSSLPAEAAAEVRRVLRLRQYPWLPPPSYPGIYSFEAARYGAAAFELCMELEARGIPDLPAAAVGALPDPAAPLQRCHQACKRWWAAWAAKK